VWPGEAVFPDFTRGDTRRWWADLHQPLLEQGVAGIWNDMNEPADFTGDPNHRPDFTVPSSVEADGDGHPRGMDYYHNAYGLLMCQSTYEGLRRFRPAERPFVLTRSGFAGIQRYAAVWIGDNHSWWEHLAMSIPMFLNMGISGMPFVGGDVGGFQLNADGELFARWMELGAFTPFFRGHTALDTKGHEPWAMGERVEQISRFYIGLRYRLLPYIYTQFRIAEQSGLPVFRPLFFADPADRKLRNIGDAFTLGSDLLVAPVVQPGKEARSVYLPSGIWYDFWTGAALSGSVEHLAHAPLDTMPIYARAGSVIPMQPVRQHTDSAVWEELTLHVFPPQAGEEHAQERILYEDDGYSLSYRDGSYAETRIRLQTDRGRNGAGSTVGSEGTAELVLTLEPAVRGVRPSRREIALRVYGLSQRAAAFVLEDGTERGIEGVSDPDTGSLTVSIPEPEDTVQLRIAGVLSHSGDR
jgi:alpha-glucosidase